MGMFLKILSLVLVLSQVNVHAQEETITKIDRAQLYSKYVMPDYKLPVEKLKALPFEEAVKYLKLDIFDYTMQVEKDYMKKVKAPVSLFYKEHTKDRIDKAVTAVITSPESFSDPTLNEKVKAAVKAHLEQVQTQNTEAFYSLISDMYYEIIDLKTKIKALEQKSPTAQAAPQGVQTAQPKDDLLTYLAVALSLLAVILNFVNGKKSKK